MHKVDDVTGSTTHWFRTAFAQVPQEHMQAQGKERDEPLYSWQGAVHATVLHPIFPALLQWLEWMGNVLRRLLVLHAFQNQC